MNPSDDLRAAPPTMLQIAAERVGALSALSRSAAADVGEAELGADPGSADQELLEDVRAAVADKLAEVDRECARIAAVLERTATVISAGEPEISEGLRLIVTQMSEAGHRREDIVSRLDRDFGVSDPQRVVDQILA